MNSKTITKTFKGKVVKEIALNAAWDEYHPEQPNIDTSGEREARAIALRNYIENDQTPLVTTEFQFNAGWDAGSAYSKAQVIDEFVRRVEEMLNGDTIVSLDDVQWVAEEMKGEE